MHEPPSVIVAVQKLSLSPGDTLLIKLKGDADRADVENLLESLHRYVGDTKTYVPAASERVFSDASSASLSDLLALQAQIEEAIVHQLPHLDVGDS